MRKLNILIVDDEEMICRGVSSKLSRLAEPWIGEISWTTHGDSVSDLVVERDVDILISDIKMPQVSGLEVIRALKGTHPRIQHIILSGHDDFAYARTALNLEVCDYLLKPVGSLDLSAALEKARKNIIEDVATRSRSNSLMVENVMHRVLSTSRSPRDLWETARRLFPYSRYQVFVSSIQREEVGDRHEDLSRSITGASAGGSSSGTHEKETAVFYDLDDRLCILVSSSGGHPEITALHARLAAACGISQRRTLRLAASQPYGYLELTREMHATARSWLLSMRLLGATGVEVAPTLPEPELIPEAVETAFYRAACGEDRDQFVEQVEKCFSKQALHTHSFEHLRAVLASAGRGLEAARGSGIDGFAAGESDGVADLAELDSLESAKSYLVDRFDSRRAGGGDRSGSLVKLAQAFIKEHYHEDVDMTAVADYLGLSYSYFGRLFKKEMGRNFFSYLCEVRLRKAMELLQDPRLSVGEVAAKVGYTNRKTFVRQFKKQFGTVPSERRGAER